MRGPRLTGALLAVILIAGALVRLLYLREIIHEPTFAHPEVDALFHDYWSRGWVTGDWTPPPDCEDPEIRSNPYLRPPGYPLFLAAIRYAFGMGYQAPRVCQALLGLCSIGLGFVLMRRRFGPGPALLYAALLAAFWPLVYFEGEFLEPAILIFLRQLLLLLLDRWSDGLTLGRSIAAGVVLGVMIVVRPTFGLLGLAVPVWALAFRRGRGRFPATASIAVFVAAALIVMLPVTVRNYVVGGAFVPVSDNGSLNLFLGNNEQADGQVPAALSGLGPFRTCFDYPGVVRALERSAGHHLDPGEIAAAFRHRAVAFIRRQPGRFVALTIHRALLFWGPFEVGHNRQDELVREHSRTLRLLPVNFPVVAASSVLGLLAFFASRSGPGVGGTASEQRRAQGALLALAMVFVGAVFVAHLPFFVAGRYRVPVVPALLIPGAYGLWHVGSARWSSGFRTGTLWVSTGAVLLFLFTRNPAGYAPDRDKWLFERARAFAAGGDAAAARRLYEQIIQNDPRNVSVLVNFGMIMMNAGDLLGAEE